MFKIIGLLKNNCFLISSVTLLLITALSLTPLTHLPTAPGSDKLHHFIAYGALLFPIALARPKYWLLIALFFALWSGAIELIQPYVNRYGELLDMLANCTGLFCGYVMALLTNLLIKKC